MPQAPNRPCRRYPCPEMEPCAKHSIKHERKIFDQSRGSATQRGYTHRWSVYSANRLKQHPLCARCFAIGLVEAAEMTDHIIPVMNADDPLFWDPTNHQSLSNKCHALKTAEDFGKVARIV